MKMLQWCQRRRRRLRVVLVEGSLSVGGGVSHGRGERRSRGKSKDKKATISDEKQRCEEGKCYVWRHFSQTNENRAFHLCSAKVSTRLWPRRAHRAATNPLLHSPMRERGSGREVACVCARCFTTVTWTLRGFSQEYWDQSAINVCGPGPVCVSCRPACDSSDLQVRLCCEES